MNDEILLTATDLSGHLACRHLTGLQRRVRLGELEKPHWKDPAFELLIERGLAHEKAFVGHLRSQGLEVLDLSELTGKQNDRRVLEAARDGVDVIVQAHLRDDRFHGYADVLIKVPGESDLGEWRYDVLDTKLAQETRGGTVLQLCLYADLLRTIQGRPAERMIVVKPGEGFPREEFRFTEYHAYYRFVREQLEAFVADPPEVYPDPVSHCDVCRWWQRCDARRHEDDHLSLVAGMSGAHAAELRRQGIDTLTACATEPLKERPKRGRPETFDKLRAQASIQHRGRGTKLHELLDHEEGRGLARLPEPSPGDVFLDFEGDPYVEGGGLEYLTGYAWREDDGEVRYTALWALERGEEKRAFEEFVDFLLARQERHPGLHVYHYAPYEPAALKRLAMRHATREDEIDALLRSERFVDLYSITRQGVRASVESYSLKPLEPFFGYERAVDLRAEASPALRRVACALEQGVPGEIGPEDRLAVEGYNRDDCLSLIRLQEWLEERRAELLGTGVSFERPPMKDGAASERAEERSEEVAAVFDALVEGIPGEERTPEQHGRWMLAHLLEYFHREDKVGWWEYFARQDTEIDELADDRKALVNLRFVQDLGKQGRERMPTHRYGFPSQEVSLSPGDEVHDLLADLYEDPWCIVGRVKDIDIARGTIDVKRTEESLEHHPLHVHEGGKVPLEPVASSLHAFGAWIAKNGMDAEKEEMRAGRDLLMARAPRLQTLSLEGRHKPLELARDLDAGLLAVQGPPGTGKTHTGARMILDLLLDRKQVGVTATSHKVIRNMLKAVLKAADERKLPLTVVHKPSSRQPTPVHPRIETVKANDKILDALGDGKLVGGVAWTWAAAKLEGQLDYLFVDEAGQMSLAHVLACARSTKNLVLLGDPKQLQQPQRGAHPEGTEVSALNHLLGPHQTMPPELGLFLEETWRLPPPICAYTSEVFYEDRLTSRPHCKKQRLTGPTPFAGAGLFLVHSKHTDNQSVSHEEVETVRVVVDRLLTDGSGWIDRDGVGHDLLAKHLLVVAPYNAQVAALSVALPGLDVGTVDRFQGRERPVVIYSMTSSSAQDAPRGMSFLYDLHRLNVATSRAQCACILVGTRALFEPECRTPEQIRWANGVCRYREVAERVEVRVV